MALAVKRVRRLSSLRTRVYAVVMFVALMPIVLVLAARAVDALEGRSLDADVTTAAETTAPLAGGGALAAPALDTLARELSVRLSVVSSDGTTITSENAERTPSLRDRIGDLFFGPEGAPTLESIDAASPRLSDRPEVAEARRAGKATACQVELSGKILICRAAIRVDGAVVVAEKSSARAIRSFYDVRYPLLKLTLYVCIVGVILAAWLGRRMVRPIEELRREVLQRAEMAGDVPPIPVRGNDELGDLAASYNALLRSLAARRRANEAFAADLAHELKSPVAAVRAAAESLDEGRAIDAERAARLGKALGRSGARLDALVTRFLDLARVEAGLSDEARARFDLAELARGLVGSMRDDDVTGGVRLDLEAVSVEVMGIAPRIESALRNVIENAVSFAGEGMHVRIKVSEDRGFAVVEVRDGGPGIAEDKIARVFERFFSERRDERGTGLGLALAKAIVEAHDGTISVSSHEGQGATFTLQIPAFSLSSHQVHTQSSDDSPAT